MRGTDERRRLSEKTENKPISVLKLQLNIRVELLKNQTQKAKERFNVVQNLRSGLFFRANVLD